MEKQVCSYCEIFNICYTHKDKVIVVKVDCIINMSIGELERYIYHHLSPYVELVSIISIRKRLHTGYLINNFYHEVVVQINNWHDINIKKNLQNKHAIYNIPNTIITLQKFECYD